jgi:hypothetical protein
MSERKEDAPRMMFAAVIHLLRRRKRTAIRSVPVNTPPLWRLLAEEAAEAARAVLRLSPT